MTKKTNITSFFLSNIIFIFIYFCFEFYLIEAQRQQQPKSTLQTNRVFALNDKHLETIINGQRNFLIKFYVNWCHHCSELGKCFVIFCFDVFKYFIYLIFNIF